MAHKNRKTQKKRGSRTHGYGNTQKHRGAGSRGGHGMAGAKKHKWQHTSKYMPDHYGHKGFKRPEAVQSIVNTINVGDLDESIEKLVKNKMAVKEGKSYKVDLSALGFDKLLGSGPVQNKINVTVAECSAKAKEKITAAGGKIDTVSGEVEVGSGVSEAAD